MKYTVIINDDELRGNGEELTLQEVKFEVGELLRSGYFDVEELYPYRRADSE